MNLHSWEIFPIPKCFLVLFIKKREEREIERERERERERDPKAKDVSLLHDPWSISSTVLRPTQIFCALHPTFEKLFCGIKVGRRVQIVWPRV